MTGPRTCTPEVYGGVTVLRAADGGRYPSGNSLVIRGRASTLLVDPSLALGGAGDLCGADAVVISHAHEDHLVGVHRLDAPVFVHEADAGAVRSTDVLLAASGLPPAAAAAFGATLRDDFRVGARPDARGVPDGHVFDLGGRTVTLVHLPGHTPGHSGLLVEPDGFLFVADIDLSTFGPFYGDVGSSLEDFERSLDVVARTEARWYGTFHHKGVVEGAGRFRAALRRYRDVIAARDAALTAFLAEPRTLADVVAHRFVYRRHVDEPHVVPVETRTAQRHLARLVRAGAVQETAPGLFRAVGPTG